MQCSTKFIAVLGMGLIMALEMVIEIWSEDHANPKIVNCK